MQRIATERPRAAFDQSEPSSVAQETSGGERVSRVLPCGVEWCAARESGQAVRDEPAAHFAEKVWPVRYALHIWRFVGAQMFWPGGACTSHFIFASSPRTDHVDSTSTNINKHLESMYFRRMDSSATANN